MRIPAILLLVALVLLSYSAYAIVGTQIIINHKAYNSVYAENGANIEFNGIDTLQLDFTHANDYIYAVDDVLVIPSPYYDLNKAHRVVKDLIRQLQAKGLLQYFAAPIVIEYNAEYNQMYFIIPVVHRYVPVRDAIQDQTISGEFLFALPKPFLGETNYVVPYSAMFESDYHWYFPILDGNYLLSPSPFYPDFDLPDSFTKLKIRDTYVLMDTKAYGTRNDPGIADTFNLVLASRDPQDLPTLTHILEENINAPDYGLITPFIVAGKAMDEICNMYVLLFATQAACTSAHNIFSYATDDPEGVPVWDMAVGAKELNTLARLAFSKYNYDICKYKYVAPLCKDNLKYAATEYNVPISQQWKTFVMIFQPVTPPKENKAPKELNKPKTAEQNAFNPDLSVFATSKEVGRSGTDIYIVLINRGTDPLQVTFYPKAKIFGIGEYNAPDRVSVDLPPQKSISYSYHVAYLVSNKADVNVTAIFIDSKTGRGKILYKAVTLTAGYGPIKSFCYKDHVMIVQNGAVAHVIPCNQLHGNCVQKTYYEAECNLPDKSLMEQVNKLYKETYGPSGNNLLLFGATGAGYELVSFISKAAADGLAGAAAAGALQSLLLGLGSLGIAYLLYKMMPPTCKARPIVALGAIPVGLIAGGIGVLALSGAGLAYCYFLSKH